jgi:hypothetical protein
VLSLRSKISESLVEVCEAVDVVRPPRRVVRISGFHGIEMGVCVEASLDLRDRRSCMRSLSAKVPWWRSSRGHLCLQRVASRRGSVRDDDAGVGGLFLSFFSPMWLRMVVCCVRCSSYGVCSCDGVCFDPLCTSVVSSYMT